MRYATRSSKNDTVQMESIELLAGIWNEGLISFFPWLSTYLGSFTFLAIQY